MCLLDCAAPAQALGELLLLGLSFHLVANVIGLDHGHDLVHEEPALDVLLELTVDGVGALNLARHQLLQLSVLLALFVELLAERVPPLLLL